MKTGAGCCRLPDQSQHKATIYPYVFHTRMLTEGFPSGSGFHRPMIADKNVCVCLWLQLKGFTILFLKGVPVGNCATVTI